MIVGRAQGGENLVFGLWILAFFGGKVSKVRQLPHFAKNGKSRNRHNFHSFGGNP